MKIKVETTDAPQAQGVLSQAIVSSGTIYVAGQIHMTPDGKLIEGSTEGKLRQIMQNIEAILRAADADLSNVVKATIYVTDMSELKTLNEFYPSYFTEPYPAREAVCVKELPLGASIEISVIAAK
jgi:2-iminobutanoate/2-iminopropanoate deaminase